MICEACGKKIPDESLFCMFCGVPVRQSQPEPVETVADPPEPWEGSSVWEECLRDQERSYFEENIKSRRASEVPVNDYSALSEQQPAKRSCLRCGKELSDTSISDYCLDCLYSQEVIGLDPLPLPAAFDAPELDRPISKRYSRKLLLLLLSAVCLVIMGSMIFWLAQKSNTHQTSSTGSSSQTASDRQDEYRQQAVDAAHKMVKDAARVPDSVHFESNSLLCTVSAGDYTVTEQFERENAQGELVASTYTAVLNLGGEKGYTPLLLQVDDSVLYDYR